MIYEYGIDPEFLIDLTDKSDLYLSVKHLFDWGNPCIISGHPIDAFEKAHEIIEREISTATSDKQKASLQKKKSKLAEIGKFIIQNRTKRFHAAPWNGDFGPEHARHPFHGIITKKKLSNNCPHISINDLRNPDCPIYKHERSLHVQRLPDVLCDSLKPLLQNSSKITFIDPYFFPAESRYQDTYKRYISAIKLVNHIRAEYKRNINIICSGNDNCKNYCTYDEFKKICKDCMSKILQPGLNIVIYRIRDKEQEIHNRYILTDIGGVLIAHGTDCTKNKKCSQDDILLLDRGSLAHWQQVYEPGSQFFDWSEQPIEI